MLSEVRDALLGQRCSVGLNNFNKTLILFYYNQSAKIKENNMRVADLLKKYLDSLDAQDAAMSSISPFFQLAIFYLAFVTSSSDRAQASLVQTRNALAHHQWMPTTPEAFKGNFAYFRTGMHKETQEHLSDYVAAHHMTIIDRLKNIYYCLTLLNKLPEAHEDLFLKCCAQVWLVFKIGQFCCEELPGKARQFAFAMVDGFALTEELTLLINLRDRICHPDKLIVDQAGIEALAQTIQKTLAHKGLGDLTVLCNQVEAAIRRQLACEAPRSASVFAQSMTTLIREQTALCEQVRAVSLDLKFPTGISDEEVHSYVVLELVKSLDDEILLFLYEEYKTLRASLQKKQADLDNALKKLQQTAARLQTSCALEIAAAEVALTYDSVMAVFDPAQLRKKNDDNTILTNELVSFNSEQKTVVSWCAKVAPKIGVTKLIGVLFYVIAIKSNFSETDFEGIKRFFLRHAVTLFTQPSCLIGDRVTKKTVQPFFSPTYDLFIQIMNWFVKVAKTEGFSEKLKILSIFFDHVGQHPKMLPQVINIRVLAEIFDLCLVYESSKTQEVLHYLLTLWADRKYPIVNKVDEKLSNRFLRLYFQLINSGMVFNPEIAAYLLNAVDIGKMEWVDIFSAVSAASDASRPLLFDWLFQYLASRYSPVVGSFLLFGVEPAAAPSQKNLLYYASIVLLSSVRIDFFSYDLFLRIVGAVVDFDAQALNHGNILLHAIRDMPALFQWRYDQAGQKEQSDQLIALQSKKIIYLLQHPQVDLIALLRGGHTDFVKDLFGLFSAYGFCSLLIQLLNIAMKRDCFCDVVRQLMQLQSVPAPKKELHKQMKKAGVLIPSAHESRDFLEKLQRLAVSWSERSALLTKIEAMNNKKKMMAQVSEPNQAAQKVVDDLLVTLSQNLGGANQMIQSIVTACNQSIAKFTAKSDVCLVDYGIVNFTESKPVALESVAAAASHVGLLRSPAHLEEVVTAVADAAVATPHDDNHTPLPDHQL